MKKINLRYQIAAGVILVICGTLVLLSDYIKDKRDVVFSEMNLALSSMNMDDSLNNQDENIDNVEENKGENPNYTYEEYLEHLSDTKKYMKNSKNYKILFSKTNTFRNINITIHSNKWVMVSKNMHPAIHFVIYHPKLRDAIENFIAPVIE